MRPIVVVSHFSKFIEMIFAERLREFNCSDIDNA